MKDSIRLRLEKFADRHDEVGRMLSDPEVTSRPERFRDLSVEYSKLEPTALRFRDFLRLERELGAAQAMAGDADPGMRELGAQEARELQERIDAEGLALAEALIPRDPHDDGNVFLEVRAAAGGDEAAIFAGDLFRMYSRYADARGWKVELLSESRGEHGGYKEVVSRIVGRGAYARLKFESGTHRVQRVPATEAQGRIHTSTCTVAILPELDEVEAVTLNPADLRIDTFRASGAGGQHINKTDSAVRITHIPTGIVVACQQERSQHKNRAKAWDMLRARLYERELKIREEKANATEAAKSDIGWGHQIRSYVLQPYQLVKDLRTGTQSTSPGDVLDGDLDAFMEASLAQRVYGTEVEVEDVE